MKGHFDFANCAHLTFVNCKFDDVGLNSSHNVTFVNCSFASLYLEECCFDVLTTGCTFGPGLPPPHPIGSPLFSRVGCERMTFRVSTVNKASLMPVSIQGNDVVFDDLTISESAANQVAYFDGDRKQVLRVRSDCPVALKGKATARSIDHCAGHVPRLDGRYQEPRGGDRLHEHQYQTRRLGHRAMRSAFEFAARSMCVS